jgi:hypothetical protein
MRPDEFALYQTRVKILLGIGRLRTTGVGIAWLVRPRTFHNEEVHP